jgi:hypothetical protein
MKEVKHSRFMRLFNSPDDVDVNRETNALAKYFQVNPASN